MHTSHSVDIDDVMILERYIFAMHHDVLMGGGIHPREFSMTMTKLCNELADIIASEPDNLVKRMEYLKRMYALFREYDYITIN